MNPPVQKDSSFSFVTITFCILIILLTSLAHGQNRDGVDQDTTYQNNTIFLPAISSSPETSFLFGGVAIRQFKPHNAGPETRPSTMLLSALYTLNNQILLSASPYLVLPDEEWIIAGAYSFTYFPESYWGIGPNTPNGDEVQMESRQFYLEQSALRQIDEDLFLGPRARWMHTYDLTFEDMDGNPIPYPTITGAEGFTSVGFGLIARLDKRNSTVTPTENYLLDFSIMTNPTWMGSTQGYTSWQFDARRYFNFNEGRSVLALQALSRLTSGNPPLKDMAILGGESVLRGYYAGRFRDNNGAQLQAEIRQKLVGRLGITSFASVGEVWHSFDEFTLDHTKWSAGGGFRFNLNRKDPMNLRMDVAFGENTSGFYLTLGEAF